MTSATSAYGGHLFCDLRGYTAFVERHGNAGAVDLLTGYRALVREATEQHAGAEIKTEGDSFYVVFPSASAAVSCGLDIVSAARAASEGRPERAIRVGVGIHAGEVAEIDGTYVGSVVNIAARVCAKARPGEVLVTETVRGLTQGSVEATFVSRGRLRLKGIREPVAVFAVLQPGVQASRAPVARRSVLGVAAAIAAVALIGLALAWQSWGSPPGPSDSSRSDGAQVAPVGPLELGAYATDDFAPAFTFGISEPHWSLASQGATAVQLLYQAEATARLVVIRIPSVYDNPCLSDGTTTQVGATPAKLIATLRSIDFLEVGEEALVSVGGHPGLLVNFRISSAVFAACDITGVVPLFPLPQSSWGANPGDVIRLAAVRVGDRTVSTLMTVDAGPDAPVVQIEAHLDRAQKVVDSINFEE